MIDLKFLVDTSVLSQARKPIPVASVVRWWQSQTLSSLALSVITVHEIREGIELAPAGATRNGLEVWLENHILRQFATRILPVDAIIADRSARLVAAARRSGHTPELADALIAATARAYGLKVATLNRKHFERLGVELVEFR
jgi:predicted nucleic acid-binding protein